jgi:hypothetical protein
MKVPEFTARPRGRHPMVAVALSVFSTVAVTAAERDLHRRPDTQIHGSKSFWRLANLNALGALAYLLWGRRPDIRLGTNAPGRPS